MPGLMIRFGEEKGKPMGKPMNKPSSKSADEESDAEGSPEQAALDGMKAALEQNDAGLFIKALKMGLACCKDGKGEEDEAPTSERY